MSNVYVIGDLHIGHRAILRFSPPPLREGTTVDGHDRWIIEQWNSVVTKRDVTWVLGDVCFDASKAWMLAGLNGMKRLVLGNHDQLPMAEYQKHFISIHGLAKYKGFWLSHAPIAHQELRGCRNIHGHVHDSPIRDHYGTLDNRYINASVEASKGIPRLISSFGGGGWNVG